MEPGHLALVCYGEIPPVWHVRLLLSQVHESEWLILTPDWDRYCERLDHLNPDFTGFEYLGANDQPPAHIPAGQIYGFQDMSPQFLAQQMHAGRLEANAERVARGFPPLAPPRQPHVAPAPAPPLPLAMPGVLGGAPIAAAAAVVAPPGVPGVVGVADCWVAAEDAGGRRKGDIVCVDPAPLPAGYVSLGNKALIPDVGGGSEGCLVVRVPQVEAPRYKLDDLRVLPVRFDLQGIRRRDFNDAVAAMVDGVPQGGACNLMDPQLP